jgi:hypothetical protein
MNGEGMKRLHLGVNLFGIMAGCLMAAAMFFPWWSFRWQFVEQTDVFPYILKGPGVEMVGYEQSPVMLILTGVLIAAILVCLAGSVLKGRVARIMLGVSGALVLLCAWRLLARLADVAERFGLPIEGHGMGSMGGFAKVEVWTWMRPGLYLIVGGGLLALLASLLFSKVRLGK